MIQMMPNNWTLIYLYSMLMTIMLMKQLFFFKLMKKKNKMKVKLNKW